MYWYLSILSFYVQQEVVKNNNGTFCCRSGIHIVLPSSFAVDIFHRPGSEKRSDHNIIPLCLFAYAGNVTYHSFK